MTSQNARIGVTGATGFLGKHLLKRLQDIGFDAIGIARHSSDLSGVKQICKTIVQAETRSEFDNLFLTFQFDCIVHCSTYFHAVHKAVDISPMVDGCIGNPLVLVDSLVTNSPKTIFINTGSSWQHYNDGAGREPTCLHSALKSAFDEVLLYFAKAENLQVHTIKLFDTYGPLDPRPKLVNLVLDSIKKREKLGLSPGNQLIDIVHIHDVVDAYVCLISLALGTKMENLQTFGVSSGREVPLKQLVEEICLAVDGDFSLFEWGERQYRPREVMRNWRSGLLPVPNWTPKIGFAEGIAGLLQAEEK